VALLMKSYYACKNRGVDVKVMNDDLKDPVSNVASL
jgi:hypothetical protein